MEIPLNPGQQEAVAHNDGPALVLAGAGSGKTRVITTRMIRLISEGVNPWAILCVTFTNKAAGEMRERIAGALGINAMELWIATFHSACLRILKEDYAAAGYPSMPVVFDATDQRSLVKSIIKGMGKADSELPARKVLSVISRSKNDMKGPEDLASEAKFPEAKTYAEVFHQYQQELKRNNAVDFDDLMLTVINLFKTRPEVLEKYRERFRYIMVDEFQDTNLVQYKLVRMLAGQRGNLFVVGDDDQSIYRWRGARVGNILGFEKDFPSARVVKLEENYRSTKNILNAANRVVTEVYGRKEKQLFTRKDEGDPIEVYNAVTETDEVDFIVTEVLDMVNKGEAVFGDMAVFYRTNAQSRVIEEVFTRNRIPYRVYGGQKFYDRKEIKDIMAYFRLAVNGNDEVSFLRAVAAPSRGVGPSALGKLRGFAREKGVTLVEAAGDPGLPISGKGGRGLKEFYDLITEIRHWMPSRPAADIIEMTLEKSGLLHALLDKRTAQDNARVENLKELVSAPGKEEGILEFLERTVLQQEADLVQENSDHVSMMTLHVSKGLEFPVVFIAGMEENLFPHFNSMESIEELDEERRLCYVGMTRAMKRLYLTHAITRRIYGQVSTNRPSPFLDDIPSEIINFRASEQKFAAPQMSQPSRSARSASFSQRAAAAMGNNGGTAAPSATGGNGGGFAPGLRVEHNVFGKGVIKKCEGSGDGQKLTILFRHGGVKKLKSRFVRLSA